LIVQAKVGFCGLGLRYGTRDAPLPLLLAVHDGCV
jgi:hypothetical protein